MQNQSKLTRNMSWLKEEDDKLRQQINIATGKQNWKKVARKSGLRRSANSCRLRWENHLKPAFRPDCKLTDEEKLLILEFRSLWGGRNCWSEIAKHLLPGRRDNDVKNFWHSLANRAKREGLDVDGHALEKRVELMKTIKAAGKFTMDYSSSIRPVAYNKLKELLPDLAVAGGVAAGSSSMITDIGAASSIDCGSHLGTSYHSVESDPSQNYSDFSNIAPTTELKLNQNIQEEQILNDLGFNSVQAAGGTATEIDSPEQLANSGLVDHGGGPIGINQVQAAAFDCTSTENSNQGWSLQMQDSASAWNTFVDAPQFHASAEQHQQLRFNIIDFFFGGGPAEFNQATAAAFRNYMRHF